MQKIKYRQINAWGCGIYALANVTGESFHITDKRLEEGKKGHTLVDLNRYLLEDEQNCYLETIYKSVFTLDMPAEVDPYPDNINHVLPLLATVASSTGGLNHMISMHVKHDKSITVFDSLKDETIETSWSEIRSYYPHFIGLFAFMRPDSASEYIMFDYYELLK